jgi:hypothetical protein
LVQEVEKSPSGKCLRVINRLARPKPHGTGLS